MSFLAIEISQFELYFRRVKCCDAQNSLKKKKIGKSFFFSFFFLFQFFTFFRIDQFVVRSVEFVYFCPNSFWTWQIWIYFFFNVLSFRKSFFFFCLFVFAQNIFTVRIKLNRIYFFFLCALFAAFRFAQKFI